MKDDGGHTDDDPIEAAGHAIEKRATALWLRIARHTGHGLVWTVGLLVVIVSVGALALILVSRSTTGSRWSLTLANRALEKSSNLRIEARRTLLVEHGARILDLRLVALDSLGGKHALVSAREARVTTNWWGLLRGKPGELAIDLDSPVVSFVRTPEGHWVLPRFKPGRPGAPPDESPLAFALTMDDALVRFVRSGETPDTVATGLALRGTLDREGRRWNAAIARGTARLPGLGLRLTRSTASASFEEGGFTVPRLVLRTDAGWVEMKGGGRISPALTARGEMELGEWEWRTLARVSGQEALDLDGGVSGRAGFSLGDRGLALEGGVFDVLWRDEPARLTFDGRWLDDHLALTDAVVAWRDTRYAGTFDWYNRRRAWSLDGGVERLNLSELPRLWPMAALDTTNLAAEVHLVSDPAGLRGRVARGRGDYRGVPFDSLAGTWAMAGKTQSLEARARLAGGSARAKGTIAPAGLALDVAASGISAGALPPRAWRALGVATPPEGRVRDFIARVEGPASSPRVTGRGSAEDVRVGGLELAGLRATFDGRVGHGAGVRITAQARGGRIGPARADTAFATGRVSADSIVIDEFIAAREDSVLDLRARAHRVGDHWDAVVEDLRWSSEGLELAADGPLVLTVHDDGGIDVTSAHVVSSAGAFAARGTWGGARRSSDLTITVETLDLEALLGSLAESDRLRGVLTGTARLEGTAGAPHWTIDLAGQDVRYREFTAAAVEARGTFAAREWTIERAKLETGQGNASFQGELTWAEPPPWGEHADAWNRALQAAPAWRGTLTADSLSLARIAEWVPSLGGWRGVLDAKIDLSGRPSAPVAGATGVLHVPGWGQATLDDVAYDLVYADEKVTVRRFDSGEGDSARVFVRGDLPMRLGWGVAKAERLPDRPMHLQVRGRGLDLGIITTVIPPVAAAAGQANLDATITGTPREPHAEGRLQVVKGVIRPAGREETFTDVDAEFALAGDSLRVLHATARQGRRGFLEVQPGGAAHLTNFRIDDYALDVVARDVTAFASGQYVIRMNGRFKIEDGAELGGPLPIPHITGTAQVVEGVFLYNFGDTERQAASQGPVAAPPWTYDVFVEADNNLWYRPTDANIEGKLTDFEVVQRLDKFYILGTVEALRGRYYFLGSAFEVQEASLHFDAAQLNNPTVDATFTAEKLNRSGGDVASRETITLSVTGRAFAPNIALSASPSNLSQGEIVSLLTVGVVRDQGAADAFGSLGARYLANQIRQGVPELSEVVDFDIGETVAESGTDASQGTTARSYTKLGLSRYFTRDLLVRYSQVVGDVAQATEVDYQDLVAEYRLNRLLFLSGQVTRRRGVLIQSQDQTIYRFDVHARHEY
jgi:hypothetical protein